MANTLKKWDRTTATWGYAIVLAILTYCLITLYASLEIFAWHTLHLSTQAALALFLIWLALTHAFTVYGGFIGSNISHRTTGLLGCIFLALGFIMLGELGPHFIYWSLAFLALGGAFVQPNISLCLGHMYPAKDKGYFNGYVLCYLAMNIGGLLGAGTTGYWRAHDGYQGLYLVGAGMSMLLLIVFAWVNTHSPFHRSSQSFQQNKIPTSLKFNGLIILSILVGIVVVHGLILFATFSDILIIAAFILTAGYLLHRAKNKKNTAFFIWLTLVFLIFAAIYSLHDSVITIYIKGMVDHTVFGHNIPAISWVALNPIFTFTAGIILLTTPFGKKILAKNTDVKFYLAVIAAGIGVLLISISAYLFQPGHSLSLAWPIAINVFISIAEILAAPSSYAFIIELISPELQGVGSGFTHLTYGLSAILTSQISFEIMRNVHVLNHHIQLINTEDTLLIAVATIILGALLLALSRPIFRLFSAQHG